MSATPLAVHEATILQHCKVLHLPTVGRPVWTARRASRARAPHAPRLSGSAARRRGRRARAACDRASAEGRAPAAR